MKLRLKISQSKDIIEKRGEEGGVLGEWTRCDTCLLRRSKIAVTGRGDRQKK